MELVDVRGGTHDVLELEGTALLLLCDLPTDSREVLDKELGRTGEHNERLFTDECIFILV